MLTREQIIARLTMLERYGPYSLDGWECDGIEPDRDGDYFLRQDILDLIKEAESE